MSVKDWGDKIAAQALTWEGKDFRPGVPEQCMGWVRNILAEVHSPYASKVTKAAVDGHWTGPALASSLAGRDLGGIMLTKIADLQPGDIVFWNDTYEVPGFGPGTITHVGIAFGPDRFIHRNTMSAPVNVREFSGFWRQQFRCALRLPQDIPEDKTAKAPEINGPARVWLNPNGATVEIPNALAPGRYSLVSSGGEPGGAWLLKLVKKA